MRNVTHDPIPGLPNLMAVQQSSLRGFREPTTLLCTHRSLRRGSVFPVGCAHWTRRQEPRVERL